MLETFISVLKIAEKSLHYFSERHIKIWHIINIIENLELTNINSLLPEQDDFVEVEKPRPKYSEVSKPTEFPIRIENFLWLLTKMKNSPSWFRPLVQIVFGQIQCAWFSDKFGKRFCPKEELRRIILGRAEQKFQESVLSSPLPAAKIASVDATDVRSVLTSRSNGDLWSRFYCQLAFQLEEVKFFMTLNERKLNWCWLKELHNSDYKSFTKSA